VAVNINQAHEYTPVEYSTEDGRLRVFGFWIFMVADLILFACLFSTYTVMRTRLAGGPGPHQLFDYTGFLIETFLLLTSSFTCGLGTFSMRNGNKKALIGWLTVTILLGAGFIGMEISEFATYVHEGAKMSTSGYLSAFFTLVGTHGSHVTLGLFWMLGLIFQIARRGINSFTARKVFIVSLYWHFLDVVWVFIFTAVYLSGKVL
jgi:cytochrome aa3-600 menaquinol oxidase subunit III